jgi:TPR repeat protein
VWFSAACAKWVRVGLEWGILLGKCYETGVGTGVNVSKALKWYGKAVDQDHEQAQQRFNNLLAHSRGIHENPKYHRGTQRKSAKVVETPCLIQ